jgi:ATP-binding cassette subfamily B protein
VDRHAFVRAWRYLSYSRAAKWDGIMAGVGTAILYVVLLILLGLFADLIVHRGQIPAYRDLVQANREALQERWPTLVPPDEQASDEACDAYREQLDERRQQLRDLGIKEGQTERLVLNDPSKLTREDLDLRGHVQIYRLLQDRVGQDAADLYWKDTPRGEDEATSDRPHLGLLSFVVRAQHRPLLGPALGFTARYAPWTWENSDPATPNVRYLSILLAIGVGLALVRALLMYIMQERAARATVEATRRLRRAVYQHGYRLGTLAFRALGPSEAVSMMTRHVEAIHDALYARLTVVYRERVKFVLLLILAAIINLYLTLAFCCAALLVWLIGGQVAAGLRQRGRALTRQAAQQIVRLQESLMLMRLVKTYLMELFNQARVERQLAEYARSERRRERGEALYKTVLLILGSLASLLVLYVAGLIVLDPERGLGVAGAITLATVLASLYWPIQDLIEHRRFLRRGRESAAVLFEFLDRPSEVGQVIRAELLPPMSRQLQFINVTLKEPGTARMLLNGVNFTIQAGQRIALVGPEDMEKHALVYLIPRFLDPTSGEIRIDAHDIRWVTLDSLRVQIALVLQHNLVFNDTVATNIGCGDPGYPLPRIIEAAKMAHAHHFIQKLPQGYETPIGELGHALRIGEQFRIALARAILREPAMYIIEEPSTPIDEDTKALIDDTFNRMLEARRTAIFLPHRLATIRSCDRIFLLHKGRIEAVGEHRELLAKNDLYRHLQYLEFNVFAEQV